MTYVNRSYPQSLAGLYNVDINNLILKPICLTDTKPCDHCLKEIRFENGLGIAEFDNGREVMLNVKYDEVANTYTFMYIGCGANYVHHSFEIKASLYGLNPLVDIMSLVDLVNR